MKQSTAVLISPNEIERLVVVVESDADRKIYVKDTPLLQADPADTSQLELCGTYRLEHTQVRELHETLGNWLQTKSLRRQPQNSTKTFLSENAGQPLADPLLDFISDDATTTTQPPF